jgi:hypothetical protein
MLSDTSKSNSGFTSSVRFEIEDYLRGQDSGTWTWDSGLLSPDFQSHIKEITMDNYYFVQIKLEVRFEGFGIQVIQVIQEELLGNCEGNDFLDGSYQRSPFECQPPPTVTKSPIPSRSQPRSPSRSISPRQTAFISRTPRANVWITPSPTEIQIPSPIKSHTPTATPSSLFMESVVLQFTGVFFVFG